MKTKYELIWHDSRKKILQLNFLDNLDWTDVLAAILEAIDFVSATPRSVILFINAPSYRVGSVEIGNIVDELFRHLPKSPRILRNIVILPIESQRLMLKAGIEPIANLYYGLKFIQVVDSEANAEKIMNDLLSD